MKVPVNFAASVEALAKSTPREAIEKLLLGLLPPVPVSVRKVDPPKLDLNSPPYAYDFKTIMDTSPTWTPDPFARKRKRAVKTRSVGDRKYKVLRPHAATRHRVGTWTADMVRAACHNESTLVAQQSLGSQWQYRHIDWNWLCEKGYITFNLSEGE